MQYEQELKHGQIKKRASKNQKSKETSILCVTIFNSKTSILEQNDIVEVEGVEV